MVQEIAKALCEFKRTGDKTFETKEFNEKFTLKAHQRVKIEDLLTIFVDDIANIIAFLNYVVRTLAKDYPNELDKITQVNLYHRLLEYMLYNYKVSEKKIEPGQS